MGKRVNFWTEGGSSIGMGHVVRCVNIARALKERGVETRFMVNDDMAVSERLTAAGLPAVISPLDGLIPDVSDEVFVMDTRRDVGREAAILMECGNRVVLIDNWSVPDADCVIIPSAVYKGEETANMFTGGGYVIIGENFIKARKSTEKAGYSLPLKVLVTMGGADPFNLTGLVTGALRKLGGIEVTVVIGPAFKQSREPDELRLNAGNYRFLKGVFDMALLMADAHIAISAVGTTVYELAYMGIPSILIGNYPEDAADLAGLEKLGFCKSLGYYRDVGATAIADAVISFMDDAERWKTASTNALSLTDGRGAERIAGIIESLAGSPASAIGIPGVC